MSDILLYMHEENGLVSIIVPIYNTGAILKETIQSVIDQTYPQFELIAIDDGSTDDTLKFLGEFHDPRIRVVSQTNQGMAQTRNNGLRMAAGEFVLFLDHDDVLASDFLIERVKCLNENPEVGFVGGPIRTFPDDRKEFWSAAINVEQEILFFSPNHLTTPSSYLIRHRTLVDNQIVFNEKLNSTADKFLLLQLSKVSEGLCVAQGWLNYRVSSQGFSQNMTELLMKDNEKLLCEIKNNELMPRVQRQYFKCMYYFMLAGGYKRVGRITKTLSYLMWSLLSHPLGFIQRIMSVNVGRQH